VRMALQAGAKMVVDTDTHAPKDLINSVRAVQIAVGAGLSQEEAVRIVNDHAIVR